MVFGHVNLLLIWKSVILTRTQPSAAFISGAAALGELVTISISKMQIKQKCYEALPGPVHGPGPCFIPTHGSAKHISHYAVKRMEWFRDAGVCTEPFLLEWRRRCCVDFTGGSTATFCVGSDVQALFLAHVCQQQRWTRCVARIASTRVGFRDLAQPSSL